MPRVRFQGRPQQNLEVGALARPVAEVAGRHIAAGEEALGRAYQKTLSTGKDVADQILKVKAQNVASYEQTADDGYMARVAEFERKSKLEGVDGYAEKMQKFLQNEDRRVRRKLGINPFAGEVMARLDRDRATRLAQAKTWENTEILEQSRLDLKSNMDKGLKYLSSVGASYDEYALQVQEMNGGISERVGLSLSPDQAQKMSKRFEYAGAFASGNKLASDAGSMMQQSWATVEKSLKPYLAHFDNARDKEQFLNDAKSNFDSARAKAKNSIEKAKGRKLDDVFSVGATRVREIFESEQYTKLEKATALLDFETFTKDLIDMYPAKASAIEQKRDQFTIARLFEPLQEELMNVKGTDPQALADIGAVIREAFTPEMSEKFLQYRESVEAVTATKVYTTEEGTRAAVFAHYFGKYKPTSRSKNQAHKIKEADDLRRHLGEAYPSNMAYVLIGLKKESLAGGKDDKAIGIDGLKAFVPFDEVSPNFFKWPRLEYMNREENKQLKKNFLEAIHTKQGRLYWITALKRRHKGARGLHDAIKAIQRFGAEAEIRASGLNIMRNNESVRSMLGIEAK